MACPPHPSCGSPVSLLAPPAGADFVSFGAEFGRRFLLVVDTEEEFDWLAPFARENDRVTATRGMARGQAYFAAAGVRPLYVTGYPVARDPVARAMMAQWVADAAADIGAHLHPWVTPPHEEEVNNRNSFAGSLPEPLERAKLTVLRDTLTESFGVAPRAYRAGRYGIGPNTGQILADLGFVVDTSVRSRFDHRAVHGPDFSTLPLRPYRAGPGRALLELPLSAAYAGMLRRWGTMLYPHAERNHLVRGVFSRLDLLLRVPLTPEGIGAQAAIRAIDLLLDEDRLDLLLFSFHSPTLEPGHGIYVRNDGDLGDFYRWWDAVLDHMARRGIRPAGLDDVICAAHAG